MTSQQIAAQVGAFQQQSAMQMQYAGMLSQYSGGQMGGFDPGQMTGSAMNTAAAIGKPVAMGGLALAGMDPIGLGLRAGMVGMRAGGLALGVGAGAATGGAALVGLGAAQYAGTQMFRGAQQQQVLGAQLNSTFHFANQYGGRGFNSGELRDIGQMMRQMSGQRGPGGEFATMDELGRLAANMGRMGMAQGVRNAKDFRDKFQQMMRTVKEVATQLSTSLEEAQKTMASMRGSGIFGAAKQGAAAKQMRLGVVAGGRTMEEMSQAASIGSQIVRAGGGRGDAGARAMMKAVTNIGAALKSGVLTEEDIYNQTGQYGAAGVQAMAASNLQQDMSFLKGNKGRYLLAGLAGKDGRLDQASLRRFMRGDMSTGEVQQRGQLNLSKVGRANFIRYEGALRGEVTAALGGMGGAMAMRGWLEQRGMKLGQMDDRNMLMYQRQMGVDRETADNQIRMLKNMPRILEQQGQSMEEDAFMRKVEQSERYKGIQGIKRKLEDARKNINDKLQQVGADFYSEGTNLVEGFINRITGRYVATIDRDLTKTVHDVMRGGTAGREAAATRLGITSKGHAGLGLVNTNLARTGQEAIFGGQVGGGAEYAKRFLNLNAENYKAAGWDISTSGDTRAEMGRMNPALARMGVRANVKTNLQERLDRVGRIVEAASRTDEGAAAAGGRMKATLRRLATHGGSGTGEAALNNFGSQLQDLALEGDPEAAAIYERYASASSEERATIMGSMMEGAGLPRPKIVEPEKLGVFESGKFRTIADRHRAIGQYALKSVGETGQDTAVTNAAAKGAGRFGGMMGPLQGLATLGAVVGGVSQLVQNVGEKGPIRNLRAVNQAYGRLVDSEDGRKMAEMVLSQDESTRDAAMQQIAQQQAELRRGRPLEELTDEEMAQYQHQRSLAASGELSGAMQRAGDKGLSEEDLEALAKRNHMSVEELRERAASISGSVRQKQREAVAQYGERAGTIARDTMRTYRDLGAVEGSTLSRAFRAGLTKVGANMSAETRTSLGLKEGDKRSLGELAMESLIAADAKRAGMTGAASSAESTAALEREAMAHQEDFEKRYAAMDAATRVEFQKHLRSAGRDEVADRLASTDATKARLEKGFKKDIDAKTGKATGAFTKKSFYDTAGRELGFKAGEIATKGLEGEAMETEMYRQLTGGMKLEGVDTAGLKKLISQLDKARVSGNKEEAAEAVKGIQDMQVTEKRDRATQEAAATASDPNYRALMDIKGLLGKNLNVNVVNMPSEGLGGETPAGYGTGVGTRSPSSG